MTSLSPEFIINIINVISVTVQFFGLTLSTNIFIRRGFFMGIRTNSLGKKIAGIFLSSALAVSAFAGLGTFSAVNADAAAADYGLMDTCQEGVILHAWQWSFNNIKANMAKIAEAGYTSVQTSVIQQAKEGTKGKTNSGWWIFYQPANFTIDDTGNSALGTKTEFKAMCEEAHKYGIHVIVDVVANHLGNQKGYDISNAVPADIRTDSDCWHSEGFTEIDYNKRYSITHGSMGGLPDLNTENPKIQNYVIKYLKECIDCGADGFRFDAAKHISIPSEGNQYTFWSNVIPAAKEYYDAKGTYDSLYCYGEILGGTNGPAISGYTQYMAVTDNSTGNDIRDNVSKGSAAGAARSNYDLGAGPANSVLWAESHDTYSGEGKESTYVSDSNINKTWAMVASRNQATALYFARTDGYRGGNMGTIYSKQCFNTEVAEVNKFHNFFNGQSEYLGYSGSIAYNERGTSGVVIVNVGGGSTSVSLTAHKMANGTYKDQVSGNTFIVANGKISGTVGSTGIAVVYNTVSLKEPSVTASPANNSAFTTDTLAVTLNCKNVSSAKYTTSEGASGTYTNGTKITVGSKTAAGSNVTVTLTGTDADGKTVTATYTYTKKDASSITKIYFDNSKYNWKQIYAYIYDDTGATVVQNAAWPGQLMTYNASQELYEITVAENLMNGKVIFTESKDSTTNRYPADMKPGLSIEGTSKVFSYGGSWVPYTPVIPEFTNSSSLASAKISLGNTAVVKCDSSNGEGTVTYGVYYKKTCDTKWTTKQNFAATTTVTIKPAYATTYDVCVKAKDSTGTILKKFFTLTVTANANSNISNTSTLSKSTIACDTNVTIKCASTGGGTGVTYAVYYKKTTDSAWTTKQNFGTNTSVTIKPASATPYKICVKAKDKSGNIAKLYLDLTVTASANSTLVNTSALSAESVKAGTDVTVKASATGGKKAYTYAVYTKKTTDSKWTTKQNFAATSSVSVKFDTAAKYDVCVKVKDASGSIAKKYFKVKVS